VRSPVRFGFVVAALLSALSATSSPASPALPVSADRIWFAPGPGTLDYLRLFENPEQWTRTRSVVTVFKFYAQHTQTPAPSIVGPNTAMHSCEPGAFGS
jgi:hypothetical protein